ncbi:chemotaxis protein CheA, partial [Burkholderia pseudomallei]|nr:chemotaxis protein CheA [Burkholderia pseudomallei]
MSADDLVAVGCFVIDESRFAVGRGTAPGGGDGEAGQGARQPGEAAPEPGAKEAAPEPAAAQPAAAPVADARPAAPAAAPSAPAPAPAPAAALAAQAAASAAAQHQDDRKPRRAAVPSAQVSPIRGGVEKVDQLINLDGKLVNNAAMLAGSTSA